MYNIKNDHREPHNVAIYFTKNAKNKGSEQPVIEGFKISMLQTHYFPGS